MPSVAPVFYKKARPKKVKVEWMTQEKPPPEAATMGLIQGRTPGSTLEWNVSQALDILELTYYYQYAIGDRGLLGTIILDFLVNTPGLRTPIMVNGRYWHTGEKDSTLDEAKIKMLMHNQVRDPVIVWEENCLTISDATSFLRQNLAIG